MKDIGSRYYTFIYTMANVMESAKEHGKEVVILDRPNPISGEKVEGNIVDENYSSFVGMFPITNRHGMTIGELALLFTHELGYDCKLTIIEMDGWIRHYYVDDLDLHCIWHSLDTTGLD